MVVTVGDIKAILEIVPDDTIVVLSTDPEGNNIRSVHGAYVAYVREIKYSDMEEIPEEELEDHDSYKTVLEIR